MQYLKNYAIQEEFIIRLIQKQLLKNPHMFHKIQSLFAENNPIFDPSKGLYLID